jgi:hypothetical protein
MSGEERIITKHLPYTKKKLTHVYRKPMDVFLRGSIKPMCKFTKYEYNCEEIPIALLMTDR